MGGDEKLMIERLRGACNDLHGKGLNKLKECGCITTVHATLEYKFGGLEASRHTRT